MQNLTPSLNEKDQDTSLHTPLQAQKSESTHAPPHPVHKKSLKDKIRLLPVFEDYTFATFSVNYWLYIEFYHMAVKIMWRLLALVVFLNLLDVFFMGMVIDDINSNLSDAQFDTFCDQFSQYNQTTTDNCTSFLENMSPYMNEFIQRNLRTLYAMGTSIVALIFIVCMRRQEENRIINNPMLYNFNWTQDLFSVLLEEIPLNTTEEELKAYLEEHDSIRMINGKVKEIIMVQDISKCLELEKKIKRLEKIVPSNKFLQRKQQEHMERLKVAYNKEKDSLPLHDGRAIVVFDSIRTKTLVLKVFADNCWDFFRTCSRDQNKYINLDEAIITAKQLPEPEDLVYENLCYPLSKTIIRLFIVYFIGLLVIGAGSAIGFWLNLKTNLNGISESIDDISAAIQNAINGTTNTSSDNEEADSVDGGSSDINQQIISYVILIIDTITESVFGWLNELSRYKSKTAIQLNNLYYSIFSSFVLYLCIQGILMIFQLQDIEDIAQSTILLFCARYVLQKIGKIHLLRRNHAQAHKKKLKKPKSASDLKPFPYDILYLVLSLGVGVDLETTDFEPFDEAANIFPLIALNFAFIANGSNENPTVIPSVIRRTIIPPPMLASLLALYIGAICDKYIILNLAEDLDLKSGKYMLKLFRFFRFDHLAVFTGIVVWGCSFIAYHTIIDISISQADSPLATSILEGFLGAKSPLGYSQAWVYLPWVIYLFYLVIWPFQKAPDTRFEKQFLMNHSHVTYDEVAHHFTTVYEKPEVTNLNNSTKEKDSPPL